MNVVVTQTVVYEALTMLVTVTLFGIRDWDTVPFGLIVAPHGGGWVIVAFRSVPFGS